MSRIATILLTNLILAGLLSPVMATAQEPAASGEYHEIPEPDLDGLSETAQEAITEVRRGYDRALEEAEDDEAKARVYGQKGRVYHAHGLYPQALAAYRNAASRDPYNAEWVYLRAYMEEETGLPSAALVMYSLTLHHQPEYVPALIRRGRLHLQTDNLEAAGEDFEQALTLDGSSLAALAGMGMVLQRMGQTEQAVQMLEQVLEHDPEATMLHEMLGLAYLDLDEVEQAREHLSRSGSEQPTIEDPILLLVRTFSTDPRDQYERGLRMAQSGNLESAVELLSSAAEGEPDNTRHGRAHALVLARKGESENARAEIRRVLELDEDDPENHRIFGQIMELEEDSDGALEAYNEALALDEDSVESRVQLADALMRSGAFEDAAEHYQVLSEQAEEAETEMHFAHLYGLAHIAIGHCSQAADIFREIGQETDHSYAPSLLALARLKATCLQVSDEELEEALQWTGEIYESEPGLETAETLAMVHAAMGDFEDAEDLQAQAIYEATRTGQHDMGPDLRSGMQRYVNEQRAERPFSANQLIPSL